MISDEYHYMFECTNEDIVKWKRDFVTKYYRVNPSLWKTIQMWEEMNQNRTIIEGLGVFL